MVLTASSRSCSSLEGESTHSYEHLRLSVDQFLPVADLFLFFDSFGSLDLSNSDLMVVVWLPRVFSLPVFNTFERRCSHETLVPTSISCKCWQVRSQSPSSSASSLSLPYLV